MNKRCRFFLRLILSAGLALMLANCAPSRGILKVNVSSACQSLPGNVSPPEIDTTSDYRRLSAEALADLNLANRRNAALRRCDAKVIKDYAKAK